MNSQQSGHQDRGPWELRFITNLQRLRERREMTQTDLAKALRGQGLPFHQQTIQRIENGDRPVRLNEAYLIAQELHANLEEMTSSFYSDSGELAWGINRLVNNTTAVTYSLIEHLSDLLTGVAEIIVTLEDFLSGIAKHDFADLPEWVKVGLACCYRMRQLVDQYEELIESFGLFAGDEKGETRPDRWDLMDYLEMGKYNLDLIQELRRLVDLYDCESLREMAEQSGRNLLWRAEMAASIEKSG